MIFKIKYSFVILELIGQPYFDLKRNSSQNVWNKCLINYFRINSLSSNVRDKTTHLSMQHCFHVVFYIIGTQYLHCASWKRQVLQNLYLTVIFQTIIKCDANAPKFKVSFYLYFCCFWINVTQIHFENIKRKIWRIISDSCFQLNCDLMLMLEGPLSHYWTSPLTLTALGGGGPRRPPIDKFCRLRKTAALSAAPLHDFFLWSLADILTPSLWKSDLPLRVTWPFATKGQPEKWECFRFVHKWQSEFSFWPVNQ